MIETSERSDPARQSAQNLRRLEILIASRSARVARRYICQQRDWTSRFRRDMDRLLPALASARAARDRRPGCEGHPRQTTRGGGRSTSYEISSWWNSGQPHSTRRHLLSEQTDLEAQTARVCPPNHEACGRIGIPFLGPSHGLLRYTELLGKLHLSKPCILPGSTEQVSRHMGLPLREFPPPPEL